MTDAGTQTPIRAIITGATGMVGEGVLHECLQHPIVASVLVINRRPCGIQHPKLKEVVHPDFFDLSPVEGSLSGYNACYFCLGVSSLGMKAEDYYRMTYTLTMNVASVLARQNPDMTFCYVSGAGTDSSEKGRSRWARVKGKTENDLQRFSFARVYAFRPGYIHPTKGLMRTHRFYAYFTWMYPVLKLIAPGTACTLRELGLAMIRVTAEGFDKPIIEGRDIVRLGRV